MKVTQHFVQIKNEASYYFIVTKCLCAQLIYMNENDEESVEHTERL